MNKKAFTLIEVLLSVAIITVLFAVMFTMLKSGNELYSGITTSIEVRQNARNAMERIVRETRESNHSDVYADHISFTSPRFTLGPIKYYLSNGQIIREYPPNTSKPVAIDVTRLEFGRTSPQDPKIDVLIQTEQTTPEGRRLVFVLHQKVRLRNE